MRGGLHGTAFCESSHFFGEKKKLKRSHEKKSKWVVKNKKKGKKKA